MPSFCYFSPACLFDTKYCYYYVGIRKETEFGKP